MSGGSIDPHLGSIDPELADDLSSTMSFGSIDLVVGSIDPVFLTPVSRFMISFLVQMSPISPENICVPFKHLKPTNDSRHNRKNAKNGLRHDKRLKTRDLRHQKRNISYSLALNFRVVKLKVHKVYQFVVT